MTRWNGESWRARGSEAASRLDSLSTFAAIATMNAALVHIRFPIDDTLGHQERGSHRFVGSCFVSASPLSCILGPLHEF